MLYMLQMNLENILIELTYRKIKNVLFFFNESDFELILVEINVERL